MVQLDTVKLKGCQQISYHKHVNNLLCDDTMKVQFRGVCLWPRPLSPPSYKKVFLAYSHFSWQKQRCCEQTLIVRSNTQKLALNTEKLKLAGKKPTQQ